MYSFLIIGSLFPYLISSCSPQFQKEIRYLDLYLGIKPVHDGSIDTKGQQTNNYVLNGSELNCNFTSPCLWKNALYDGLLDTSDYYRFYQANAKSYPMQIGPGNSVPIIGSMYAIAGNTSNVGQSSVLVSAPIACQKAAGKLTFKYWLHNSAKVEVILLKPGTRGHQLQASILSTAYRENVHLYAVLMRPTMNCNIIQPRNSLCDVTIEEIEIPFRIGIRAYNLKDMAIGSLVMITDLIYNADVCLESKISKIFGRTPVPVLMSSSLLPKSGSQYNCVDYKSNCLWSNSFSSHSEWRIGKNKKEWTKLMKTRTTPSGTFFYQHVDMTYKKPYSRLQSEIIPCTKSISSLSFRYWLTPGTQVQVCSVDEDNIALSCAYLTNEDSPGPIIVDVDSPVEKPFRFVIEMIEFNKIDDGLIVIDDLKYSAILCNEDTPVPTVSYHPYQSDINIESIFNLQPLSTGTLTDSTSLDCEYDVSYCGHWQSVGEWYYGMRKPLQRAIVDQFIRILSIPRENSAIAIFNSTDRATLISPTIPCAIGAYISVAYYCENAILKICIKDRCSDSRNKNAGVLKEALNDVQPFQIVIFAEPIRRLNSSSLRFSPFHRRRLHSKSSSPTLLVISAASFAIVKSIRTQGFVCDIPPLIGATCSKLKCAFSGNYCQYHIKNSSGLPPTCILNSNEEGMKCFVGELMPEITIESPDFQINQPIIVEIQIHQKTFGSEVFICDDEEKLTRSINGDHQSRNENCHTVSGPILKKSEREKFVYHLDEFKKRFSILLSNKMFKQFGEAEFELFSINIYDEFNQILC